MIMFEATPENINSILAAEAKLDLPKCLTFHHFILKLRSRMLAIMFIWDDSNHNKGKQYLEKFIAEMPAVKMNTVGSMALMQRYEHVPLRNLPWRCQRSLYVKEMPQSLVDMFMDALKVMPLEVNMGWPHTARIDHSTAQANYFGAESYILLSFSDMVPDDERLLAEARAWNDALYDKLRASGESALLEGSYPPLAQPGDRTTE